MAKCPSCHEAFEGVNFCPSDGARLLEADRCELSPLVGQILDKRYRVIRKVGDGASAEVFYAEHIHLKKQVALKVLRAELAGRSEAIERFQREAQVASGVGHPNIVKVEDFCILEDGSFYLAMEWLDGETLGGRLIREPMPIDDALEIAKQTCSGLQAAHSVSIIHRDLKPANIFLQEGPRGKLGLPTVKILDFGIAKFTVDSAKLTRAGVFLGTPYYVSPEQAQAQPVDHRADIYSLGVIMYEMVTGSVPFDAESALAVLQQHVQNKPVPPREMAPDRPITPELERIILRCMHKIPEKRFKHAADVEQALSELESVPSSTLPGIGLKLSDLGLEDHEGINPRSRRGIETDAETLYRSRQTADTQPAPINEDLRQTNEQPTFERKDTEDEELLKETGKHSKRALNFETLDDPDGALNEFNQLTKTTRIHRTVRSRDVNESSPPHASASMGAMRPFGEDTLDSATEMKPIRFRPVRRQLPWLLIGAIVLGVLGAGAAAYRFLITDDPESGVANGAPVVLDASVAIDDDLDPTAPQRWSIHTSAQELVYDVYLSSRVLREGAPFTLELAFEDFGGEPGTARLEVESEPDLATSVPIAADGIGALSFELPRSGRFVVELTIERPGKADVTGTFELCVGADLADPAATAATCGR